MADCGEADCGEQERGGTAVDFSTVYTWHDAGGTAYYVRGELDLPARVELAKKPGPADGPVVFEVLAHPREDSGGEREFLAWGATRPQAEVEIHGRTRIWRSAVDEAQPWIPHVEPWT